jgi:hypothetical protein
MLRLLKGDKEWTSVTHNLETSIADYNEELKYFSMGMLVATFNEVKCTTPHFHLVTQIAQGDNTSSSLERIETVQSGKLQCTSFLKSRLLTDRRGATSPKELAESSQFG